MSGSTPEGCVKQLQVTFVGEQPSMRWKEKTEGFRRMEQTFGDGTSVLDQSLVHVLLGSWMI